MRPPKLIGYWRDEQHPELPDPVQLIDADWDKDEQDVVATYLESGTLALAMMGHSKCRICGVENGFAEFTDGVMVWPTGLAHYVAEHNVRLPQSIIDHVVSRADLADQQGLSAHREGTPWWVGQVDGARRQRPVGD